MMRHTTTFSSLLFLLFLCAASCAAETERQDQPYIAALRSLSVNRSLVTKTEDEYRQLQSQEAEDTTGKIARRLSDLRYKLQAYHEDAERLRRMIPADKAPAEVPGPAGSRIDIAAEKRVEEKIREIYRMHEKALERIAARRFDEAERLYEEIVLVSPDDDEAYLLLGHTGLAAGHYEKAGHAFHSAIHIDPANIREIPRLYENILVENPSDDGVMTQLGYAHLLLGSAADARRSFEDALAVNPSNIEAKKGLLEIP